MEIDVRTITDDEVAALVRGVKHRVPQPEGRRGR